MFLMLFFGVYLRWLPVAGYAPLEQGLWEHLRYLILPAMSLGIVQAAYITRMTRSALLEVLYKNYIRTARAKGLPEWKVLGKHVMRNAILPVVTYIGPMFAALIMSSFARVRLASYATVT